MSLDAAPDWVTEAVAELPPILTTNETIRLLRLSRRTFYRLVADGRLKTVQQSTSHNARHMVPKLEIVRYLRSLEVSA